MSDLLSFQAHMQFCMRMILAPMMRPDIHVTIIVRAPEALPSESMVSTNGSTGSISAARDALDYIACGIATAGHNDSEDAARFRWLLERPATALGGVWLEGLAYTASPEEIRAAIDEYRRA